MANYFDIDDILAEDELVPAIFREATNGVGLFDTTDDTNKVEPGSKVELPFWLARELHLRQAVTINVPPCFNKKTREEIDADAAHVDLRNRCPYFYDLGYKIAPLIIGRTTILVFTINSSDARLLDALRPTWYLSSEKAYRLRPPQFQDNYYFDRVGDKTIGLVLLIAFRTRYKEVLIKAHTAAFAMAPKFLSLLTEEETKLYEAAQSSAVAFKKWRMGGPRFEKASVLGRKRKPIE